MLTGTVIVVKSEITHAIVAIIMFIAGVLHICTFTFTIGLIREAGSDDTRLVKDNSLIESLDNSLGLRCIFGSLLLAVPVNVVALLTGFIVGRSCDEEACIALSVQMIVVIEYNTAAALFIYAWIPHKMRCT